METRTMYANTTWTLKALILAPGETDNEFHIFDSYQRELLTLIFKVCTPTPPTYLSGPGPTTMSLPDSELMALLRSENLELKTERLTYIGIYILSQLQNMTDAHRRNYGLHPRLVGIGTKATDTTAATPPQDVPARVPTPSVLSHTARRKRKHAESLDSSKALASMSSLLESFLNSI